MTWDNTHEQWTTCYSVYTLEVQVHCLFLEWPFRKDHCFSIYNQQYQGTSLWSLTSSVRRFYRVILGFKPWTKDSVINHPEFHGSRHQRRFFLMVHIILATPNDLTKGNSAGGRWWISVTRTQRLQGGPRIQLSSSIITPRIGGVATPVTHLFSGQNPIYHWVAGPPSKKIMIWIPLWGNLWHILMFSSDNFFGKMQDFLFAHLRRGREVVFSGVAELVQTTIEHDTVDGRNPPIGMYKTL